MCSRMLQDLWQLKKWKYFINLTGQEFPLMTNLELIRTLKAMEGENVIVARKNDGLVWSNPWILAACTFTLDETGDRQA